MEMYVFRFQVLTDEDFSGGGEAMEPIRRFVGLGERDPLSRSGSDFAVQDHLGS